MNTNDAESKFRFVDTFIVSKVTPITAAAEGRRGKIIFHNNYTFSLSAFNSSLITSSSVKHFNTLNISV
jgi:hypothetical protein